MNKLFRWKIVCLIVCLVVTGVVLSLLALNVVRADSFTGQAAKLDIVGVHLGMTPAQVKSVLGQYSKGRMNWQEDRLRGSGSV